MKLQENQAGGESVILEPGDDLDRVPKSHRNSLTSGVLAAFANPAAYFHSIAERCSYPALSDWLRRVTANPWKLCLHDGQMCGLGLEAGYYFQSDAVTSATVYPAKTSIPHDLAELIPFYELLDSVHWDSFGCSGGLFGSSKLCGLAHYGLKAKSRLFPAKNTFVWGSSAGGDALICTSTGTAGFLSHESGKVQNLGTIDEAINWVFGELLQNRVPEFDYG